MEASQTDGFPLSTEAPHTDGIPLSMEESEDLCDLVFARYRNSGREDHQRLCAVIGAMSQELKDHNLPSTPISYFGATISSLSRLSSDSAGSDPVVAALLTILSLTVPKISVSVLRVKKSLILETVERILGNSSVSIGAVKAGLKCISHLIVVGDKKSWSSIAPSCEIILRFLTDHRAKVRKHSHSCLSDVLKSFQGSSVLAPASEGITSLFERFLLLAGGSRPSGTAATEKSKGALEVLYILAAMRDCLPLMSMKFTTNIFKYMKTLLELQQPIVTRHVMNILQVFCLNASSEFSPEVLLDLLCSLASSLTVRERTTEEMTCTARLLHVGVSRVYSRNREICAPKLPYIFSALGEILTCEHEESIHAATDALIGLIETCIDEKLIYDNSLDVLRVDQSGSSGPTVIGKICATVESLLGYQYNAVWDLSFRVVSAMFAKLGDSSVHLMRGSIQSLADMQKLSNEDLIYRKQLLECVGSAVGAMGPKNFLSLLPLNLDVEDLSDANVWLIPVLKQYIVGAHLSFFTQDILGLVGILQQKSEKLEREGRIVSSRTVDGLVYSIWSLLPAFCNYPVDTAGSFGGLTKPLSSALHKAPDLHGLICSSIQILIQQNKRVLEENVEPTEVSVHEKRARNLYTKQVAADNLNTLRISAPEFLSDLLGAFLKSSIDSGGCLQATIGEFASIADKKFVKRFFSNTMKMLLKVTKAVSEQPKQSNSMQIDDSANDSSPALKRIKLLDLAISILPGLGAEEVDLVFIAIEPIFKDEEGFAQKKAYKILSIILKEREEFIRSNLDRILELMIEVMSFCHFSAKRHRLDCLFFLIAYVVRDPLERRKHDVISSFLTEIILALKEPNKKTRNRAYDLLVKIGHACGDEDQGGKKENLHHFFSMVAGGLAGDTPHMISAAVKGLARLAYEFSDLISTAYNLLPSAYMLLQRKNREIIKANLGLLKVIVAKSQADGLQSHLKSMVEGLLKWQDNSKNHFKAKVKLLLEMLVKKCGLDAVKAAMPEEHMKLLTNIRKAKERKERKMSATSEADSRSLHSKATTSRLSRWNHTNIFSDFGDEEEEANSDTELMEATSIFDKRSRAKSRFTSKGSSLRSTRARPAGKSLAEDFSDQLEDDPLDLLDRQKTRAALRSSEQLKRKQDMDNDLEIDSDGRLVIREDDRPKKRESSNSSHDAETRSQKSNYSHSTSKSLSERRKRQKTSDAGWAYTGNEYKSKRARGDLKKKGKLEPYAYWPLDRKMLSRREDHKATARKGMASVVKLAKKLEGKSASSALSVKGSKLKKPQHRKSKKSK